MKNKVLLPLLVVILLNSACAVTTPVPIPTSTAVPSASPTLPPTSTPTTTPTATPLPATPTVQPTEDTSSILERLGGVPCPDSEFTCITLTVPLDHFNPASPKTIDVVFAVLPAEGESKGMFVTATGGPGYSGLAAADDYTSYFDPSILENFDIVFFDQRGIGQSGGMQCVDAAVAFYRADWRTDTPQHQAAFLVTARTFAQDCVKEIGYAPEDLTFYGTTQAVEDLEDFRQVMGGKLLWLYGESYGTQYAQTYAAVHPQGLGGLILDGTVDLTLTDAQFYTGAVHSFYNDLIDTLHGCSVTKTCAAAFGGDALQFYRTFTAKILAAPQTVNFPLPSGRVVGRPFSVADLEYVVSYQLYTEDDRQILLRALAAAYRGDLVPLLRILYIDLSVDPETLKPIPYPDYSDAAYYTITCDDYSLYSGSPEERAQAMFAEGEALTKEVPYLHSIFYGDIPCIYWPVQGVAERPAPLIAQGIPTLVLGATADPITPVQYGEAVFSRLENGYSIITQGGAHVTFGRGNSCPDDIVTAFLVNDQMPAERETTCDGVLYSTFVPLAPVSAAKFNNPLEAMSSVDDEFYYTPEYYYWDYVTPTTIGCTYGGTFSFKVTDSGEAYTINKCAFSIGFIMTGDGSFDNDSGIFSLHVKVAGLAIGELTYTYNQEGVRSVTGTYNGEAVDLSND
jgi:pimeloyl-ACP methyl ester carboxylesterase